MVGDVQTDDGVEQVVLKLLPIKTIVKEALCNVLAKTLGLPVSEALYVNVSNIECSAPNDAMLAFGTVFIQMQMFMRGSRDESLTAKFRQWPQLLHAGAFDLWIANEDRLPNNLAMQRSGAYLLFDHGDAFPEYISHGQQTRSDLLEFAAEGKSLAQQREMKSELVQIIDRYNEVDWGEVMRLVNSEQVPDLRVLFQKYIVFLKKRLEFMEGMIDKTLGSNQSRLF